MTTPEAILQTLIPVSLQSQLFGRVAFGTGAAGLLLLVGLHFAKPDLAPSWHMVSEYAIGSHGWLMTACFAMLAISCVSLLVALVPLTGSLLGWFGLAFLLITACAYGLAAIFPTDPITVGPDQASAAARMHALAFAIGVPGFILASQLISFALVGNPLWDNFRLAAFSFAHLNWIGLGLMVAIIAIMLPKAGGFGPEVLIGWPNRLMFVTYFGWLVTSAWPLVR
jgi:hypothetical protein